MVAFLPTVSLPLTPPPRLSPRRPVARRPAAAAARPMAATPPPSTSTPTADADADADAAAAAARAADPRCRTCGRASVLRGCDGSGRVTGGLGAVLPFWPIKAYRPCPDFVAVGGKYTRKGQSLDEIAFGRKGDGDDVSLADRLKGKK